MSLKDKEDTEECKGASKNDGELKKQKEMEEEDAKNSGSSSSGSSEEGSSEGSSSDEDLWSIQATRSDQQLSRRLKCRRQKKKKTPKKASSKRYRGVPVRTVCMVNTTTADNEMTRNQRSYTTQKKRATNSTLNEKLQFSAKAVGVSVAVGYYVWQHYELLLVLAPTFAMICGLGIMAIVLIQLQDKIRTRQSSSCTSSTASMMSTPCPSLLHLPCRLDGSRELPNEAINDQRPNPQQQPQRRSSIRLSHILDTPKLNPIVERKLEDDWDKWWNELDSQTQYYALILGYTPCTWDKDYELEDLPCEDWDWDEMTSEQKAAAQHFGYTQEEWDVE